MNDFKLIMLACICVLFSCTQKSDLDAKPADLLSEEQMTRVLVDIHITESALSLKNFNRDSSLSLYAGYQKNIFKEHQITEEQFRSSYNYYSKHSGALNSIYEVVIDSIGAKEAKGKL